MKSALLSIASAALFVAGVYAQTTVTINTPANVVVCQPVQLTWIGGTAPYFLSVHAGATPDGSPLINFGQVNSTQFTWTAVNEAAGTSIGFTVTDSNGVTGQTAPVTVLTGTSTSCLNSTASGTQGPPVSTTATSSTPTNTSPSGTTTTPNGGSSSSSSPKTSTTTTTSSNNAANPIQLSYGIAGVLGLVIAAVLA